MDVATTGWVRRTAPVTSTSAQVILDCWLPMGRYIDWPDWFHWSTRIQALYGRRVVQWEYKTIPKQLHAHQFNVVCLEGWLQCKNLINNDNDDDDDDDDDDKKK